MKTRTILIGLLFVLGLATSATAQRYISVYDGGGSSSRDGLSWTIRFGGSIYGGDTDGNSLSEIDKYIEDLGLLISGELAFLKGNSGFGVTLQYGRYTQIEPTESFTLFPAADDTERVQLFAVYRWMLLPDAVISPYLHFGANLVYGHEYIDAQGARERRLGYGPTLGGGVDISLSGRVGFLIEITGHMTFPDIAADSANYEQFGAPTDDPNVVGVDARPYDVLGFIGFGLRFSTGNGGGGYYR